MAPESIYNTNSLEVSHMRQKVGEVQVAKSLRWVKPKVIDQSPPARRTCQMIARSKQRGNHHYLAKRFEASISARSESVATRTSCFTKCSRRSFVVPILSSESVRSEASPVPRLIITYSCFEGGQRSSASCNASNVGLLKPDAPAS